VEPAVSERVEVVDEESVVDHGTRRVTWFARVGDTWQRCSALDGATVEQLAAGPGTVWRTRIEVVLPRGTGLRRQVLSPSPAAPRDALSYLMSRAGRSGQRLSYTYYKVCRGGTIERADDGTGRGSSGP
jgi:hypothetical protein